MTDKNIRNYCVLTMPLGKRGTIPLSNLITILEGISNEIYLVTGGEGYGVFKNKEKIHAIKINYLKSTNNFIRILRYIKIQFEMSWSLFKHRKNYNSAILFIGGEGLILPSITLKMLKKDTIIVLAGFPSKISKIKNDPLFKITNYLSDMVLTLSNKIIVYSEKIVDERDLQQFDKKIFIAHRHYVESNKFKCIEPLYKRENLVGYIGALTELKGLKNFVRAINIVLIEKNDLKFMFIGDGPLEKEIEEYIDENDLKGKIILNGWVPHDDLPYYLNKFKLFVLPSYTEGLPNVIIEAMACGTPVLTTSVGAIPDIIEDEYNGFITEDNSPSCLKKNILRALEYPETDQIIKNAQILIENDFNEESVLKRWKKILE